MKLDTCLDQLAGKLAPWMVAACAPKAHSGLGGMAGCDILKRLQPLFPSPKRHLDSAAEQLHSGSCSSPFCLYGLSFLYSWDNVSNGSASAED